MANYWFSLNRWRTKALGGDCSRYQTSLPIHIGQINAFNLNVDLG